MTSKQTIAPYMLKGCDQIVINNATLRHRDIPDKRKKKPGIEPGFNGSMIFS